MALAFNKICIFNKAIMTNSFLFFFSEVTLFKLILHLSKIFATIEALPSGFYDMN